MFVELHLIQSFVPSNLNRDDSGTPKDCLFGGTRRARISSQCQKRSIRRETGFQAFLEQHGGAVRTRRLVQQIASELDGDGTRPASEETLKLVADVFKDAGLKQENDGTSSILLYMARPAIAAMVEALRQHRDDLQQKSSPARAQTMRRLAEQLGSSALAPDIALFGRMIEIDGASPFGKAQLRVDAACQVAHALSTHPVELEFDFFTAVDDLKRTTEDDAGAAMLGSVEFNAACYYRYLNIDLAQLSSNLHGDEALARKTLAAALQAMIEAIPTGKQTSFAAQNPPAFIFAVARQRRLWNLANAFCAGIETASQAIAGWDVVRESVARLEEHWNGLVGMYGSHGIDGIWASGLPSLAITTFVATPLASVDDLIDGVLGTAQFTDQAGAAA